MRFFLVACLFLASLPVPALARRDPPSPLAALLGQNYQSIRLLRGSQNHLLAIAKVNGVQAVFGVDTGAPVTALNVNSKQVFGVGPVPAATGLPSTVRIGREIVSVGMVNDFEAGGMRFGLRPVALVDLSRINDAKLFLDGRPKAMDGLIGADFLLERGGILNYRPQQLFIRTGKPALNFLADKLPGAGFIRVPMEFDQGHFTIRCVIEGRPYRLIVDTGAFITLVDRQIMFRQGINGVRTPLNGETINGHRHPVFAARLRDFIIGDMRLPPVAVGVTDLSEAWTRRADVRPPLAGLLGGELLAQTSAIIDVENLNLYLSRELTRIW